MKLCWHRWGPRSGRYQFGMDAWQRSRCLKCGKERTRKIGFWLRDVTDVGEPKGPSA
jgi:hypothetical protein